MMCFHKCKCFLDGDALLKNIFVGSIVQFLVCMGANTDTVDRSGPYVWNAALRGFTDIVKVGIFCSSMYLLTDKAILIVRFRSPPAICQC